MSPDCDSFGMSANSFLEVGRGEPLNLLHPPLDPTTPPAPGRPPGSLVHSLMVQRVSTSSVRIVNPRLSEACDKLA